MSVQNIPRARENPDLLGDGKHAIRVPEGESAYDNRAPVMANRDLVVTEVLEPIVMNGERAVVWYVPL